MQSNIELELDNFQVGSPTSPESGRGTHLTTESVGAWIIQPELFTQYHSDSIWMFWAVAICNAHTILMTILLLKRPSIGSSYVILYDTLEVAGVLGLWFVVAQGATIQVSILLFSLVEMKWKSRLLIRFMIISLFMLLMAASTTACIVTYMTYKSDALDFLFQLVYLGVTLGLLLASLIFRQLFGLIRALKKRFHRL